MPYKADLEVDRRQLEDLVVDRHQQEDLVVDRHQQELEVGILVEEDILAEEDNLNSRKQSYLSIVVNRRQLMQSTC